MKIECHSVNFSYDAKSLISKLSLKVNSGDHVWIRGSSGSGKSSFLKLLAGMLNPISGKIFLNDVDLTQLNQASLKKFRLNHIGYTHQENHQIEHWTVEQNLNLIGCKKDEVLDTIESLNLSSEILRKLSSTLSGGEKQRVSLARLILQKPQLALIDEPTAHLDDVNTEISMQAIIKKLQHSTLVIVSHDHRMERFKFNQVEFKEINK